MHKHRKYFSRKARAQITSPNPLHQRQRNAISHRLPFANKRRRTAPTPFKRRLLLRIARQNYRFFIAHPLCCLHAPAPRPTPSTRRTAGEVFVPPVALVAAASGTGPNCPTWICAPPLRPLPPSSARRLEHRRRPLWEVSHRRAGCLSRRIMPRPGDASLWRT